MKEVEEVVRVRMLGILRHQMLLPDIKKQGKLKLVSITYLFHYDFPRVFCIMLQFLSGFGSYIFMVMESITVLLLYREEN